MKFFNELYDSLPIHLRDDKDFIKLFKIFFNTIEESYEVSHDTLQAKMVDELANKFYATKRERYAERRTELVKLHLNELFDTLEKTQKNQDFFRRLKKDFKKLGLKLENFNLEENFLKVLTQDNINANKSFNFNKGKLISFIYAYNIVAQSNIQFNLNNGFIKFIQQINGFTKEPIPFSYKIESNLYKETFDSIIKPLTHPIGFGFSFATLLSFLFEDYFFVTIIKHLEKCVIKCLQPDGTYKETNLQEHKILAFDEINTDAGTEFWIKYQDKNTNEIKILEKGLDNVLRIYSLDNLKIKIIQVVDEMQGFIKETKDPDGNITSIDYHQFFINRKSLVRFLFQLTDDIIQTQYEALFKYDVNDYGVVAGENYMEAMTITPDEVFSNIYGNFKGKCIQELPRTCGLEYELRIERISQIKDEINFNYLFNFKDYFRRVVRGVTTKFFIGKAFDPTKNPKEWEPEINEPDYYITDEDPPGLFNTGVPPLPSVDLLGKNEKYWFENFPYYNNIISTNEVSSTKADKFNEQAIGREIFIISTDVEFKNHEYGVIKGFAWSIGDDNKIGCDYTIKEIHEYLKGEKHLAQGEFILTIGKKYRSIIDNDKYSIKEINDDEFKIEIIKRPPPPPPPPKPNNSNSQTAPERRDDATSSPTN